MAFVFTKRARNGSDPEADAAAQNPRQLLAAADLERDSRRWAQAAGLYEQYLAQRPQEAPIWVQLGHALKESGDLAAAESAYRESLSLAPETADTQLQLGHLYKRMRNFPGALTAYREAVRLDGTLTDARRELANLGLSARSTFAAPADGAARGPATFLDLSDLFFYLRHHKTVSGIQRVQLGIATAIIAMPAEERAGIFFLTDTEDRRGFVVLDDSFVTDLARELRQDEVEHLRLLDLIASATTLGARYAPTLGDTLLMLGAFWVSENIAERVVELGRRGVRLGTLIHDIIPITHPEFCVKDLTDSFRESFSAVLRVASFVLSVSEHTARCLGDFIAENRIPPVPIYTFKSAHQTWEPPPAQAIQSPAIARLLKEEYVLYVSTIEIRKNHIYLFRIWRRLLERLGRATPYLVLVGRPGWRVGDLMDQLDATANLNGRIVILHDLSDMELAALYRGALFTVFPSFEEGWGLPVGESLIFGRPCIASNTSSVPEVAGDLVDYVDPFNDNDGFDRVLRFIEDRDLLARRASDIAANFRPRGWSDVARDLVGIVGSALAEAGAAVKPVEPFRAEPGRLYRLGHQEDVSRHIASGDATFAHFACVSGWDRIENFGRWLSRPTAAIEFATEPGGRPIVVALEWHTVGWLGATQLQISMNGARCPPFRLAPGAHRPMFLDVVPDEDGRVAFEFAAIGEIAAGTDERSYLWLGLGAIGCAPRDDAAGRAALLEDLAAGAPRIAPLKLIHAN